ncbi:MAG: hypothetical protein U0791_12895 [Gemmataceae bacterium]
MPKISFTRACTRGMRVMPPTITTSSIWAELQACVRQRGEDGLLAPLDQVLHHSLQLVPRDGFHEVQRVAVLVHGDERVMSAFAVWLRSFLARSAASLSRCMAGGVLAEVDAVLALELVGEVIDDRLVENVAAEVGVAVGAEHLEHAVFADVEDRDVEGAAAEVEDTAIFWSFFLSSVGHGAGGGLVDDAHPLLVDFAVLAADLVLGVEAGDGRGVDGGLPLRVVEVRGHGDDGLADGVPKVRFRHSLACTGSTAEISGGVNCLPSMSTFTGPRGRR